VSLPAAEAGVRARTGSLTDVPFEQLLFDAFRARRTCALELRKRQIRKVVLLDHGAPVECVSNLKHESLGQFLTNREKISAAEFKDALAEAAARELRLGEVLLERELIEPGELADALRQNLAYKLLECFTWSDGEYRVEPWMPEPEDVPVIDTARVIFTGIAKFVPRERVSAALGPLLEHPLVATEQDLVDLEQLRMSPAQRQVLRTLRRPTDVHALFHEGAAPRDELTRTLYAASVMGLVSPADAAEGFVIEPAARAEATDEPGLVTVEVDTSELDEPEPWQLRDEVAQEYRELPERGPHDLLGVAPDADHEAVRARYRALCRRYAPDRFEHPALLPVAEMAAELLFAVAAAYEELSGRSPAAASARPSAPPRPVEPEPAEISPDPRRMAGEYARQARERMASGNFAAATGLLTLALRSDPANRTCRVELAYARFREMPERAAESLEELEGLLNAAPGNALAHLYAAEVSHAVENHDRAAAHFRAGCELWEQERA
jgi:hypothetical protein